MDDLSARMRAAAESPPPTRIDLDALISGELRRRRTLGWAGGAGAIAAAVALAIAVPTVFLPGSGQAPDGGGPVGGGFVAGDLPSLCAPLSPSPTMHPAPVQSDDTVRPLPSEPVAQAVPRLTEAMRVALGNVLPDGMTVEAAQPGCAVPQFQYQPSYREYSLGARIKDRQGYGNLSVQVLPSGTTDNNVEFFYANYEDCSSTREPDGTVVVAGIMPGRHSPERQYLVYVRRPDGATVLLSLSNFHIALDFTETVTRPEPPLTREQLISIGRAPGLTLYP